MQNSGLEIVAGLTRPLRFQLPIQAELYELLIA